MGSKLVVSKISTINYNLQKRKFSLSTLGTSISISISCQLYYPLRLIVYIGKNVCIYTTTTVHVLVFLNKFSNEIFVMTSLNHFSFILGLSTLLKILFSKKLKIKQYLYLIVMLSISSTVAALLCWSVTLPK